MSYVSEVLADAPEAYWPLTETAGDPFADASGNGRTLVESGGSTSRGLDGPFGATSGQVTVTDGGLTSNLSYVGLTAATVEFWWKGTDGDGRLVESRNTAGDGVGLTAWLGWVPVSTAPAPGRLGYGTSGPNIWRGAATTAGTINDGEWHHVALVMRDPGAGQPYITTDFSAYVDGVLVSQVPSDYRNAYSPLTGGPWAFLGGGSFKQGGDLAGSISQIAVYHHALPAARIAAHYSTANAVLTWTAEAESDAEVTAAVAIASVTGTVAADASSDANAAAAQLINNGVSDNRVGGRWRNASGTAEWSPPVVIPQGYRPGRDVALAFTQPVVDETTGRVAYAADKAETVHHLDRIIVGGKDITVWRGIPTPLPATPS